jgi:D-xylulose reductase
MTKMQALVLERKGALSLRDVEVNETVGLNDVRIKIHTVGVCGSDVHYYTHGAIGPFVVKAPMILGHEASGTVIEVGSAVTHLTVGDRVCMEPGIPDPTSRAVREGMYNVDPAVRFWATPPIDGVLRPEVVHPASFTYRLPDNVSFAEAAMVEPFAVGMQAAVKAKIKPGDVAAVTGCGTIGIMIALAALAGGCSRVFVSDYSTIKLAIADGYDGIVPVDLNREKLAEVVYRETGNWGADVVFEASGNAKAFPTLTDVVRPGGAVVLVGLPVADVAIDVNAAIGKEIRIETVFRYANVFDRALGLIASGKVNLKPLITETFSFERSIEAFDRAAEALPGDVKLQITL